MESFCAKSNIAQSHGYVNSLRARWDISLLARKMPFQKRTARAGFEVFLEVVGGVLVLESEIAFEFYG